MGEGSPSPLEMFAAWRGLKRQIVLHFVGELGYLGVLNVVQVNSYTQNGAKLNFQKVKTHNGIVKGALYSCQGCNWLPRHLTNGKQGLYLLSFRLYLIRERHHVND